MKEPTSKRPLAIPEQPKPGTTTIIIDHQLLEGQPARVLPSAVPSMPMSEVINITPGKPWDGPVERLKKVIEVAAALNSALSLREIHDIIYEWKSSGGEQVVKGKSKANVEGRKRVVRLINAACKRRGQAIKHPESGEPCFLAAVQDKYGCRFALEHHKTKKRSHSTNDIDVVLTYEVTPIALAV